ncbi:MAG: transposase [Candidatus Accumulibacter sp.]|jgi:transposase|nr:transposase [Accumulibacter sp.]
MGRTTRIGERGQRHAVVGARGVPLSLIVSGANVHDSKKLGALLDARQAHPSDGVIENLCLDAGYVGKADEVSTRGYIPHIRPRGEEISESERRPDFIPRRWVVECFHSWTNRFRKLTPRYEKTDLSYLGLLHLAAAMITLNKIIVIYG